MSKQTPASMANPFGDLYKLVEQFKVPGVDMDAIVESRRKDMDALIATNQATLDSMQLLGKKQAEILTQALQSVKDNAQTVVKSGADPAKQAELARKAYEKAVAQMTELSDMARKAQADAMAGITARAQQSVQELKALTKHK
jgi:phasin family protein